MNKHRDRDLLPNKTHKRRIFSSAGARKTRISKQRNRVQTAKYIRNVNKAVNTRWKGGSQLSNYNQKSKHPSTYGKLSEKKKMKIPLADYQWPESNNNNMNNQRPTTAYHGSGGGNLTNYEDKRRNIQSRGKAIPTGLSGTSQSDQFDKGKRCTNVVLEANPDRYESFHNDKFSKTQTNLIDGDLRDLILAESDPVDMDSDEGNMVRSGGINLMLNNNQMNPIKEESASKNELINDSPEAITNKENNIEEDQNGYTDKLTFELPVDDN
jgi:hypothetical protein